jgi:hypothetical protein
VLSVLKALSVRLPRQLVCVVWAPDRQQIRNSQVPLTRIVDGNWLKEFEFNHQQIASLCRKSQIKRLRVPFVAFESFQP